MQSCAPKCLTGDKPKVGYANGCDVETRPGGIPRLLFLICDPLYEHPFAVADGLSPWSDLRNVHAAMCAGLLNFTGEVLGSKPKGTFTKKRTGSCSPEKTVGGSKTVVFQDYNASDDLIEFDFWDWVNQNTKRLKFGWVNCSEMMYMYQGSWDLEIDEVEEDTNDGSTFMDGLVTMSTKDLIKPVYVPGIMELIENFDPANCYS